MNSYQGQLLSSMPAGWLDAHQVGEDFAQASGLRAPRQDTWAALVRAGAVEFAWIRIADGPRDRMLAALDGSMAYQVRRCPESPLIGGD